MLTDVEASAAQASDRDYKLADANGLYLFVTRSGFKSWRMKYRFGGKEKRLTFGAYPEVSLSEARARRDEARALLRDNVDPGLEKQRLRAVAMGGETLPLLAEDELPFEGEPNGYAERDEDVDGSEAAMPSTASAPIAPPPVQPAPTIRIAPPPPPERPVPVPTVALSGATPASDPAPNPPVETPPVEVDTATGSRAVSLLKQAELAAETAASQSRSARRITIAVLALFGVMALALGWWLLSHPRGAVAAAGRSATMPPATAAAPIMPAATTGAGSTAAAHPSAPSPPPPSAAPPLSAGTGSGGTSATAPMPTHPISGDRADAPTATRHLHRSHHRHRHHARHRARHRHGHHARHATANLNASTGRGHAARATATPSAQETYHAIDVAAPRGAAIDPALDRAGRAALCLRAAYSASPGCAAVR